MLLFSFGALGFVLGGVFFSDGSLFSRFSADFSPILQGFACELCFEEKGETLLLFLFESLVVDGP